jgi:hypothetical protein
MWHSLLGVWHLHHATALLALDTIASPPSLQVASFAELLESRLRLAEALREAVADPAAALRFLQPGRLIRVDSCPPQPDRPLPSLGQYQQQPAAEAAGSQGEAGAGEDAQQTEQAAAAAAAGCSGAGPEVLSRVDSSVWGVLVNFEKAGKHKQQQAGKLSASSAGNDSDDDPDPSGRGSAAAGPRFVIDVLVNVDAKSLPGGAGSSGSYSGSRGQLPTLLPPGAAGGVAVVLSLPLEHLSALSAVRLKALKDLRSAGARSAGLAAAAEVLARYAAAAGSKSKGSSSSSSGQPPLLDPQQDMQVRHNKFCGHSCSVAVCAAVSSAPAPLSKCHCTAIAVFFGAQDTSTIGFLCCLLVSCCCPLPQCRCAPLQLSGKEVGKLVSRLEALEARLTSHALWASSSLLPGLVALQHKQALAAAARAAKKELKAAQGLVLADELKSRMRVLRRLGYLDPGGAAWSAAMTVAAQHGRAAGLVPGCAEQHWCAAALLRQSISPLLQPLLLCLCCLRYLCSLCLPCLGYWQ